MASRATRYLAPVFRSGFRSSRTAFRASARRGMSTTSSPSTQSSDLPWVIGSGLVFVPTIAWILSSGKGKGHAHHGSEVPEEHVKVAEEVKEALEEPVPESIAAEPTSEPVPEEKPAETTPESSATESVVSDDDGVVISKEDLEESINRAIVRTHASLFGAIVA
ncbi:hypothetical protein BDM02DRAFT_319882 [Thelephora ganbajun]|uniref:Uncharacterized protein n=1 Tax=Thelephora ganbajun TaxID=370292 RepID=A0ACB6Z9I0_THEGA|nr:hypothetical protein BDM02DRAFT_319882 [Thelephora ganbajun]